jgi:hypothetical protein
MDISKNTMTVIVVVLHWVLTQYYTPSTSVIMIGVMQMKPMPRGSLNGLNVVTWTTNLTQKEQSPTPTVQNRV